MNSGITAPGFPCPQCGFRLMFSLAQLLSGVSLNCPHCSLELTVDEESSASTMLVLAELHGLIEKSRSQLRAASSGGATNPHIPGEC